MLRASLYCFTIERIKTLYATITEGKTGWTTQSTLYRACRSIVQVQGGAVIRTEENGLVAFWCDWDKKIKPGFGATSSERQAVEDYHLTDCYPVMNYTA
jgi:hypothetical protein